MCARPYTHVDEALQLLLSQVTLPYTITIMSLEYLQEDIYMGIVGGTRYM